MSPGMISCQNNNYASMGVSGTKHEALLSNIVIKWCLQAGACSCFIENAPLASLDDIVLCMHPRVHNTCMLTRVQACITKPK